MLLSQAGPASDQLLHCSQASLEATYSPQPTNTGYKQQRGLSMNSVTQCWLLTSCMLQVFEAAYMLYRGRYFLPILVVLCNVVTSTWMSLTQRKLDDKVKALINVVRLTPVVKDRWVFVLLSWSCEARAHPEEHLGAPRNPQLFRVRCRWVRAISSHCLVPGDVVVLQQGRALGDLVLLRGACLVTESTLSGEVQKPSNSLSHSHGLFNISSCQARIHITQGHLWSRLLRYAEHVVTFSVGASWGLWSLSLCESIEVIWEVLVPSEIAGPSWLDRQKSQ